MPTWTPKAKKQKSSDDFPATATCPSDEDLMLSDDDSEQDPDVDPFEEELLSRLDALEALLKELLSRSTAAKPN